MIRVDPENGELQALRQFAQGFAGKRVLEIGCGDGRITRQYAAESAWVDAIDPVVEKIERARQKTAVALQERLTFWPVALEQFAAPRPYEVVLLSWSL
jgi:2-polyprenyl-3-methyl-5-hydroxy-6-metoxy-1,4-benzoquinol methylase